MAAVADLVAICQHQALWSSFSVTCSHQSTLCRRASEIIRIAKGNPFVIRLPGSEGIEGYVPCNEAALQELWQTMSTALSFCPQLLHGTAGDVGQSSLLEWWPKLHNATQSGEVSEAQVEPLIVAGDLGEISSSAFCISWLCSIPGMRAIGIALSSTLAMHVARQFSHAKHI